MRRPGMLSVVVFCITAGVMLILTAIRWNQRAKTDTKSFEVTLPATAMREVAWNDLPVIEPFQLTERSETTFDSKSLEGKVWLASFFFTSCPSICRDQNGHLSDLQKAYRDQDLTLVSITCDPENDTPLRLREYADSYAADANRWLFLTGETDTINEISESQFITAIGTDTHGTNLMLVDKWGRFRDRFDWQNPAELLRLRRVLDDVLAETETPGDRRIKTRTPPTGAALESGHGSEAPPTRVTKAQPGGNGDADQAGETATEDSFDHGPWRDTDWIESFTLTERSGEKFRSDDLKGKVWVASFFFATCPSICRQQNSHVRELHELFRDRDVTFVSITTDPENDTLPKLRAYADEHDAGEQSWLFLTGDELHIRRIASEYFQSGYRTRDNHTTALILMGKDGKVRGSFSWEKPESLADLRVEIEKALLESAG